MRKLGLFSQLGFSFLLLSACGTTDDPPNPYEGKQINILTPEAGNSFKVGDSLATTWKLQGKGLEEITGVNIMLSPNDGQSWFPMRGSSMLVTDPNFGTWRWKIADSIEISGQKYGLANCTQCRVRVQEYSPRDETQISTTGQFTINP